MTMTANEPLLLNATDAARLLGVSRQTFYRLHGAGRLPLPVRLGRSCWWRSRELDAWVEAGCPGRAKWEATQGFSRIGA